LEVVEVDVEEVEVAVVPQPSVRTAAEKKRVKMRGVRRREDAVRTRAFIVSSFRAGVRLVAPEMSAWRFGGIDRQRV
jgi:hypothetical protein